MDKQKQQLAILGVLLLVLVVFLANAFMPKKKPPVSAAAAVIAPVLSLPPVQAVPTPKAEVSAKASPDELKAQQDKAAMDWGMDPFFHSAGKEVYQGSSLVLKGISIGKGRRKYATINDEIVTIGDSLFGYNVEEIDKSRVLLKRGSESYYLVFPEQ